MLLLCTSGVDGKEQEVTVKDLDDKMPRLDQLQHFTVYMVLLSNEEQR